MVELARAGVGILLISSDLPEVLQMSDRVIVMHEGRITGRFSRSQAHRRWSCVLPPASTSKSPNDVSSWSGQRSGRNEGHPREREREARVWLAEGSWGWLRGVARARGNIAFILLITIGLLASLLSDVFLTRNLVNILSAIAVIGIISLGQTMLIISGNFDMSVASVLGFAGIVAVATQRLGAAEHPARSSSAMSSSAPSTDSS